VEVAGSSPAGSIERIAGGRDQLSTGDPSIRRTDDRVERGSAYR
jgi:hypothetical protein